MFLTKEVLEKYYACNEGLEFFQKYFPNGAELKDVITMRHIPKDFLYWGYMYLDTTNEEKELFFKVMEITNSSGVYRSKKVDGSQYVSDSTNIKNSSHIFYSEDVTDSKEVVSSENVEGSIGVFNSTWVTNSTSIAFTTSATDSSNIVNSQYIVRSHSIIDSSLISDCHAIRKGKNLSECVFCANCEDMKKSLFCIGQSGAEYMLFNKPIDPTYFDGIMKMYKKLVDTELKLMSSWTPEFISPETPTVNYDVRRHYATLSQKFMKWLRTLPNYDPKIMYQITYLPEFAKEM